ncbi:MAG: serine/threonine-protein kinase [Acidimicrobiales bacterium]
MRDRSPRSAGSIAEPDTVAVRALGADDSQLLAGRYELGEVLGRGATGVVHRGRDRVLRRDVAIKLLYPDLAREPETSARFQQEAQLAARIHHPNAVAIFDTGVHDGQPFIVMECLPGETLATRIAAHPLPVDEVCEIGAQLLGALADAHTRGVLHRDIKPSNLLLTPTGSVKVADFGIATEADRHSLTSVGFVVGTLAYLAPERLRGVPATAQSDIYAAGGVLYESLTGHKPFGGTTAAEILDQITHGSLTDIASLRPDINPAVAQVVLRALAKEPAARFASASEMATALAAARSTSNPTVLAPVAVTDPALAATTIIPLTEIGPVRNRRSMVFVAVVAALALALGAAAFASRDGGLPTPTTTAPVGGDAPADNPAVVPRVSTTVVTTTVRPATTRPAVTTAPVQTSKGRGKKDD